MTSMIVLLAALTLISPLYGASPDEARARAKRQLTLRAAAQKVAETLDPVDTLDPDTRNALVSELSSAMLSDVVTHRTRTQSLSACVEKLTQDHAKALEQRILETIGEANRHTSPPISITEIRPLITDTQLQNPFLAATAFAKQHAGTLFTEARTKSVALQRDQLRLQVPMPPPDALNAKLAAIQEEMEGRLPALKELASLVPWLVSQAQQEAPALFEEIHHSTEAAAEQVVQQIRTQYQGQAKTLSAATQSLPPEHLLREEITEYFEKMLEAYTDRERTENHDPAITIYPPLAPILDEAGKQASELEPKQLCTAIASLPAPPCDLGHLAESLMKHPEQHRSFTESTKLFSEQLLSRLRPWFPAALESAMDLQDPISLRARLAELLDAPGPVHEMALAHIEKALTDELKAVRDGFAITQLTRLLGSPASSIECLPHSAISILRDDFAERPADGFESAWEILSGIGMIKKSGIKEELIDESRSALTAWASARVTEARQTMATQEKLLRTLEQEWAQSLQRDVAKKTPIKTILTSWHNELASRWTAFIANQPAAYLTLLPSTEALLEKTVRKLYDSTEAEAEAAAQAENATPAEPEVQPEEPQPEEPEPETPAEATPIDELLKNMDFVLYMRDTGKGKAEATLLSSEMDPIRMAFDPSEIQNGVDSLFLAIQPTLSKSAGIKNDTAPASGGLLKLFKRPEPLQLKIAVLVGSREVRHMTGILLRNRVQLFVEDWNADPENRPIELEWEDDLELISPSTLNL